MSDFADKKKAVRVTRAKAAVKRADDYLRTHSGASAVGLIRDLRDMLKETTDEIEFPTATGESQYG